MQVPFWFPRELLLMEEILQQLIGSRSIISKVLYIPGGTGFLPSTVRCFIQRFFLGPKLALF